MAEAHEQVEHAEHIEHAAGSNKKIALVIAVMALLLAFSETLGKSAQTEAMNLNIQASDLWNFFQAKTIRRTVVSPPPKRSSPRRPPATKERWPSIRI